MSEAASDAMEPEVLAPMDTDLIATQERATLDVQILTAKANPRSIQLFQSDLATWALSSPEIAESCTYVLPRGGRQVGPSIRFAELVTAAYQNLRIDSKPIAEGEQFIDVEGTCMDLERNIGFRAIVKRRITNRNGERYNEDMIGVTIAAASSIAIRNAIFRTVPRALWEPIWEKSKLVAQGSEASFEQRCGTLKKWLETEKIPLEHALDVVGRTGWKDLVADDLVVFTILRSEIVKGNKTKEEAFPVPAPKPDAKAAAAKSTAAEEALAGAAKEKK